MNPTCVHSQDDYADGDVLALLPCKHHFHSACVNPWLVKRCGRRRYPGSTLSL